MQKGIKKILIANRGEVVKRIAQTLRRMNIISVGVHAANEKPRMKTICNEVLPLQKEGLKAYLDIQGIIAAAKASGCDAIHPGWGFLSEDPKFAKAVEEEGLIFIGPTFENMQTLGDKLSAKQKAEKLNIPTVNYVFETADTLDQFVERIRHLKFPVMIKPVAGGGGKGMIVVSDPSQIIEKCQQAKREAKNAFGNDRLICEEYIQKPRHVEVQLMGDGQGRVWSFGERDCTIQRRHQKIIEESPSPHIVNEDQRERLTNDAIKLASSEKYRNAGTVEFMLSQEGHHFFMEMNTRLQVEHGVTEMMRGVDLVELQVRVACGENIEAFVPETQERSHVIQVRVYAEDPYEGFLPSTGKILALALPNESEACRIDSDLIENDQIDSTFDPMLMKLLVKGTDRKNAISQLRDTLCELCILGVSTNINLINWILGQDDFVNCQCDTAWTESQLEAFKKWETSLHLGDFYDLLQENKPEKLDAISKETETVWSFLKHWRVSDTI